MEQYLFLLGAPDAEMTKIETAVMQAGHAMAYAADLDFKRVTPRSAYHAVESDHVHLPRQDWDRLVTVECDGPVAVELTDADIERWIRIDHHNPGDPGFDRPPEQFWSGSSIGQAYELLGLEADRQAMLVAASDHCPGHAYKGRCPGVTAHELAAFRIRTRARFTNRSIEELETKVEQAQNAIRRRVRRGDRIPFFKDHVPELPEASLRECTPVAYELNCDDGCKVGLLNGEPTQIAEWMNVTAPEWGLSGIYGAPERGYAGGYR